MFKICKNCNEKKELSCFYKSKSCKDGYVGTCKECERKKAKKRHKNTCLYCGKDFFSEKKNRIYCGRECQSEAQSKNGKTTKKCSICSKDVTRKNSAFRSNVVCCSKECHDIYLKNMNNKKKKRQVYVCDYCNKEFERTICSVNGKHHIFCSYECKNKANKIFYIGENAPRWNNSKTQEEREQERKYPEYYNWRRSVFERDNYTCQCCGDNKGNNLVAHHILNYSKNKELRTVITNGVTLCETCHTLFHKTFGYNDNNQVQLFDFINKFKNDNTEPSLRMA